LKVRFSSAQPSANTAPAPAAEDEALVQHRLGIRRHVVRKRSKRIAAPVEMVARITNDHVPEEPSGSLESRASGGS
jgi:hypothetical protein